MTGLVFILEQNASIAIWFVFLSGILDFFDGLSAKLLKAYSELGKSLDSLADVVSFGVLPAFIAYSSLVKDPAISDYQTLSYLALLIPLFSAYRLAKFNIDEEQSTDFKGLPTPANAFMVSSAVYVYINKESFFSEPWMLLTLILAGCFLMVSNIRMFSLKFNTYRLKDNLLKIILIVLSGILVAFLGIAGILLSIIFYILLSVLIYPGMRGR
jgi:CDP-diacylglycerol--serine O-phosphatidyltransferase